MRTTIAALFSLLTIGCGLPHSSLPCGEPCEVPDGALAEDGGAVIVDGVGPDAIVIEDGAAIVEAGPDAAIVPDAAAEAGDGGPEGGRCGDGVCGAGESCELCPSDCTSNCVLACVSCENDGQCSDSQRCVPRGCDGRRACHTMLTPVEPAHGCVEVSGVRCDVTRPYHPCSTDAECGAGSSCMAMGASRVCRPACTNASQCPSFRSEGVVESCSGNDRHCYLSCQRSGDCPFGLACFPFEGGIYGFCGSIG